MYTKMFMTWNLLQINPSKVMLGFDLILLFENIMISVFDGLNSIPHFSAQLLSVLRSLYQVCSKSIWFLKFIRSDTSWAKSEIFDCMSFSISFKKIRNYKGANIDPCGSDPNEFM